MAINIQAPQLALEGYLRAKQQEQEKERQEQLHEEAQAQLQEIAKFHAGNLDIQKKHLALTQSALKAHLLQQYYENVAGGKQQPASFQDISGIGAAQPQEQQPIQGGASPVGATVSTQGQPVQALPGEVTPEQAAQRTANIQTNVLGPAEITQAVNKAKALGPVEAEAEKQKKAAQLFVENSPEADQLRQKEQVNKMAQLNQLGVNAAHTANIVGSYGIAEHNIMAASAANVAHITNDIYSDPGVVKGAVRSIVAGTQDITNLPPKTRLSVEKTFDSLGWPVPNDKDKQDMNNYKQAEDLLTQILPIIKDYSTDGPKGGLVTFVGTKIGLPTDAQAELDQLQAKAAQLATVLDPKARVLKSVLQDQMKGVFDLKSNTAQNMMRFNSAVQSVNSGINNHFSMYPADEKNAMMGARGMSLFGGLKDQTSPTGEPDWLSKAPKTNKLGHTINKPLSLSEGKPIYNVN